VPKVSTRVGGFLGSAAKPPPGRFDRAFNEVVAGNQQDAPVAPKTEQPTAVAPGMLFASAVAGLGIPTAPPVPGQKPTTTETKPEEAPAEGNARIDIGELPQPSLFTTHKPWRCPNPGCNKAYKQSNGLKYHQQKGYVYHDV
jgi:transcription factor SFP1